MAYKLHCIGSPGDDLTRLMQIHLDTRVARDRASGSTPSLAEESRLAYPPHTRPCPVAQSHAYSVTRDSQCRCVTLSLFP